MSLKSLGATERGPRHLRSLSNFQYVWGKDGSTPAGASGKGKKVGIGRSWPKGAGVSSRAGSWKDAKHHLLRSVLSDWQRVDRTD